MSQIMLINSIAECMNLLADKLREKVIIFSGRGARENNSASG